MNLLAFPLNPLREALVPEFHRHLRENRQAASAFFSRAMSLILLVAGTGVLVGLLFAGSLADLAVSGKQLQLRSSTVGQLYWLAPAVLLLAVSETLNAILAAYDRVIIQSSVRLLGSLTNLTILSLFAGILQTHVLAMGLISAQLSMAMVQMVYLCRHGLSYRPAWPGALGARFLGISSALLLSYAASQAYAVFEKHTLTSFAVGLVSSFQYSMSMTNIIITLVGITLASVLWPRFLKYAASENRHLLYVQVLNVSRLTFLVTGLLCSLAWMNAESLIQVLFARGAFDSSDVSSASYVFRITVFTAVPISVNLILGRALISLGSSRSLGATGFTVALTGSSVLVIAHSIGSASLAISHWLFANTAGLAIQALLLVRICGGSLRSISEAFWWLLRWILVLLLAGLATQSIPQAHTGFVPLVTDVLIRSLVFSALCLALAWPAKVFRGLPAILTS